MDEQATGQQTGRQTGPADRRRGARWLVRAAVPLGVAGAFVAGMLVSQSGGSDPGPAATGPGATAGLRPAAFTGELSAASCEELLDHYVDRALDVVGPDGWQTWGWPVPPRGVLVEDMVRSAESADSAGSGVTSSAAPQRATSSATGTNVQEAGVDEPDVVKTDGRVLVRLREGDLITSLVTGPEVVELARLDLEALEDLDEPELLLAGDTVVVLGSTGPSTGSSAPYYDGGAGIDDRRTQVLSIDISDPTSPVVVASVTYDTGLVAARQHGDTVRLVLDAGLPRLDFVRPGPGLGQESAREANEQLVRDSTLEDWLPSRSLGDPGDPGDPGATGSGTDAGEGFLECADVAVPQDELGLDTTAVVGFDAADPGSVDALGLAGSATISYESADHLYLASGGTSDGGWLRGVVSDTVGMCLDFCPAPYDDGTTHLYDFALDGTAASYVGAGEVAGRLADRWSLDEHDGVLRLALEATRETGDHTSVVTMGPRTRPDGTVELVELGRLDGLGQGEQLQAVRWFDDLALLVTFRRIDPLYAVSLEDPATPTELGELKIPGFSEYLHPLGSDRLIGVGEGPTPLTGPRAVRGAWGAQVGLFDVTDLTDPRRIDVVSYAPGSRAGAATDPRQLTWLPGQRTVLTVIMRGWRSPVARISILRVDDGELGNEMVRVARGSDAAGVRLVPLPDERVVLVAGDDARFLTL